MGDNVKEIFITNVGDIPGYIHFREQRLVFGGQICCCPDYIELTPGSYQAFSLQYRSPCVGEFTEEIRFHIVESEETLKFILSGRVRSVSLEFCSPLIDFGNVSFGFPVSRTLEFHSNSPDPVSFLIRVDGDGRESPLTYEDYLSAPYQEMSAPPCPREFLVEPERGVVQPGCSARIKITLTCNRLRMGHIEKKNNLWTVSPERGIVSPNSSLDLTLSVNLMNAGPVTSAIHIHVKHSEKLKVKLMASGIGYSIRTEPSII
ncbi:hydrocephalus-inducing protein homolog [Diaphorina citri]|uniref:Hydrocephalus-inducing protein homolog n=1 Tax=Diaphorina citri TaxID=121845 RepID=A0A3Q0IXL0_DIACI|nr:hydrocephalus-inducing protein homolog [Diaphorina citri]